MNKIHKIIWSKVRHCYVVVSEITKRDGKSVGGFFTSRKRNLTLALLTFLSLSSVISFPVYADTIGTYHTGDIDWDKSHGNKAKWDNNHKVTDEDYGSIGLKDGVNDGRIRYLMGLISGDTISGKNDLAQWMKHRTAIGNQFRVHGFGATAYGYGASAVGDGSLSVGHAASTNGNEGTAIGSYAKVLKGQGTVVGANSWANDQAVALGADVRAQGYASISIGSDDADPNAFTGSKFSDKLPEETIKKIYKVMIDDNPTWFKNKYMIDALGNDRRVWSPNYAAGEASIAIGSRTVALGDASTSIGVLAMALADRSTALGVRSLVSDGAKGGMALGEESRVMSKNGLAVGNKTYSSGSGSLAYGYDAKALGANSIAIGHNVGANAMLNSEAQDTMANVLLYNGEGKIRPTGTSFDTTQDRINYLEKIMAAYDKKDKQWVDDEGSVIRQWKDGNNGPYKTEYRKKQAQTGTKQWSDNAIAIGRRTYAIGNNSLVLGSLSLGVGNNSLNVGHFTYTKGENSAAIGMEAAAIADNSMAIGVRSFANLMNSIAIGVGSKTDYTKEDLEQDGWAPRNAITFPSSTQVGVVSVGKIGSERRISNVASGYRDTDAVNVSQLRALEERFSNNFTEDSDLNPFSYLAVDKKMGDVTKVIPLQQKEMNYRKYVNYRIKQIELQVREKNKEKVDETFKDRIQNVITNLEKGDNKTGIDASGLKGKNVDTILNELKAKYPGLDTSDTNDVINKLNEWKKEKLKDSLKKALTNDEQGFLDGTNYLNDGAKGKDAIAVGYKAQSLADNSIAIGKESHVEKGAQGGIALGASSSATRAGGQRAYDFDKNTVYANDGDAGKGIGGLRANKSTAGALSIGSDSITRQITNVAGGSEDTDAVNVAQLKQVNNKVNSVDTKVNNVNNKVEGNIGFNIEGNSGGQPWVAAGTKDSQKGKISLKIRGGDNDSNINVDLGRSTNDGFDTIEAKINLKHNLGNLESATFTKTEKGVTTTSVINDKGLTIGAGNTAVALTKDGLNMSNHQIHGVAEGKADTDAVNVAQVNKAIQAKADELKKNEIKTAQDTANTANSNATEAKTTANTAKTTAEQAKTTADKVNKDLASYKTEVTGELNNKANTGLDNLTQSGKTVVKNLAKEQIDTTVTEDFVTGKVKKGSVNSTTLTVTGDGKVVGADLTLDIKDKAISKGKLSDELVKEIEGKATKAEVANKAEKTYVDNQLNTKVNTSDFDTYKGKVTTDLAGKADVDGGNITAPGQWAEKLGTGKVAENDANLVTGGKVFAAIKDKADKSELTNKADTSLNNITEAGNTVIKNLAKGAVKVADGTNTTVTTEEGTDGSKTYKVNVSDVAIKTAVASDLNNKADKDATNIDDAAKAKWAEKLGTGKVEANDTNLVTGGTVQAALNPIKTKSDKNATDITGLTTRVGKNESNIKTLQGGFTLQDANKTVGKQTVKAGSTVTVTGDDYIKTKVDTNGLNLSMDETKLNEQINTQITNNSTVTGKMSAWKLKAGTGDEQEIKDGNTVAFDVAEADKGLTVTQTGKTIKYGINTDQVIDNINNSTTKKITNVDGDNIDLSKNTYITNITKTGGLLDKKADKDATNIDDAAKAKWAEKLGTGKVEANDTNLVTGKTVKAELDKKVDTTTHTADLAKKADVDGGNITAPGQWATKLGTGEVVENNANLVTGGKVFDAIKDKADKSELTSKANTSLDNISDDGKTVIKNLAKGAVKVADGTNTTVTTEEGTDGSKTYKVNVSDADIKKALASDLNNKADKNTVTSDLAKKADKDAGNIGDAERTAWAEKLGTGTIADNDTNLVTGKTVYDFVNPIKTKSDNNATAITKLQTGFTIKDETTGTGSVTLGGDTTSAITFKASTANTDGATSSLVATVDADKNVTYTLNTKKLKEDLGIIGKGVGTMSSWKIQATGGTAANVADGETVEFGVAEADKGLTVTQTGKTIKYGINTDQVIDNINNSTTKKITNVDGDNIDLSKNTYITNITKTGGLLDKKADKDATNIDDAAKAKWAEKLGTGKVEANDTNLVTGKTVKAELDKKVDTTTHTADLAKKADVDGGNITAPGQWATKLGTGTIAANDTNLVTGKTVYDFVNPVKTQSETNKTDIAKLQKGFTIQGEDASKGSKVIKAEDTITFKNGTNLTGKVGIDGSVTYSLNDTLTGMKSITFAAQPSAQGAASKALTIDGTAGTIAGLTNTAWNANSITSGRAATEDQLKQVAEALDNNATAATDFRLVKAGTTKDADGTTDYTVDEKGKITLTVQDKNHKDQLQEIAITDVARKSDVDKMLNEGFTVGKDGKDGTIGVNGADGKDGIGINGKDGGSITIHGTNGADGQDGQNGLTIRGVDGKKGEKGEKGVDGKDVNRIVTVDPNGTKHQLATLDDGLKFAGNSGNFYSKLNETVEIVGGVTIGEHEKAEDKLTDENIGVVAKKEEGKNGKLDIKLAKNLKNLSSATFTKTVKNGDKEETTSTVINDSGTTVTDKDGNTNQTTAGGTVIQNKDGTEKVEIKKDGITITDGPAANPKKKISLTKDGFDNGGNKITNIADGKLDTDAATVGQVNAAKKAAMDTLTAGFDVKAGTVTGNVSLKADKKPTIEFLSAGNGLSVDLTTDAATHTQKITYRLSDTPVFGEKAEQGEAGKPGKVGKDGKVEVIGKDGSSVVINGKDGSIGLNGTNGQNGLSIRGEKGTEGKPGVDGTTVIKRIVVTDSDGNNPHSVATLDDGLKFAGDSGDAIAKKLNETVTISGGVTDETKLSDNNVGVVAKDGKLNVKLAKNLTGLESATFTDKDGNTNKTTAGGTVIQNKAGTEKVEITKNGITIMDAGDGTPAHPGKTISLTKDGFDNGGNKITNIADGTSDNDAATVGQVNAAKEEAKKHTTVEAGDHLSIKEETDKNGGKKYTITGPSITSGDGSVTVEDNTDAKGKKIGYKLSVNTEKIAEKIGKTEIKSGDTSTAEVTPTTDATTNKTTYTVKVKDMHVESGVISYDKGEGTLTLKHKDGEKVEVKGIQNIYTESGKYDEKGKKIIFNRNDGKAFDVDMSKLVNGMNFGIAKLDNKINRVGSGAAALAALKPLEFDPEDKWDVAVGYGNYMGANSLALGAFYRPNENTMFSLGGSFGDGENIINVGLSMKVGKGIQRFISKAEMANRIVEQDAEIAQLKAKDAQREAEIKALREKDEQRELQMKEILKKLNMA